MNLDVDCQTGTSVGTVRMLHYTPPETTTPPDTSSQLSSPRSGSLPSPPDSPISTSSFPSLSSSFFFSSAAASPPHPHTIDPVEGLVIPSLTLPEPLHRPTPFGQTLGDIRLLLIGSREALSKTSLITVLLDENEDVVDISGWRETRVGRVLRASTHWVTQDDQHTYDKYEPANNVEIIEMPYGSMEDSNSLLDSLREIIQTPYRSIADVVDPDLNESYVLNNLLSSPSTPLYTAAVMLLGPSPTPLEMALINDISIEIPLITHPRLTKYQPPPTTKLPAFRPTSLFALKNGLFRSPDTLYALRSEAADRFLRWRKIERSTGDLHSEKRMLSRRRKSQPWDKAQWEAHLEESVPRDHLRRRLSEGEKDIPESHPSHHFDPLHLPSLFFLSLSLLRPLASRIRQTVSSVLTPTVGVALVGGFCLGFYANNVLLRA